MTTINEKINWAGKVVSIEMVELEKIGWDELYKIHEDVFYEFMEDFLNNPEIKPALDFFGKQSEESVTAEKFSSLIILFVIECTLFSNHHNFIKSSYFIINLLNYC